MFNRASLGVSLAVPALVLCACAGADSRGNGDSGGVDVATTLDDVDSTGTDGSESGEIKLDFEDGQEGGGDEKPAGCEKVDLLFVVDDSPSTHDDQVRMIGSFSGFAQRMRDSLINVDSYHIAVVSTDSEGHPFNEPQECRTFGSSITRTGHRDFGPNPACGPGEATTYADGGRYMTENDDLDAAFTCAANLNQYGSGSEFQIDAMFEAISPELNAPGACNEGYVRDDSLLIVVFVTDEDDNPATNGGGGSDASIQDWYDQLVASRGGVETNIVVLSLLWGLPGATCPPQESQEHFGLRLGEFTEMFTNGLIGDVCLDEFSVFFTEAVSTIADACDGYTPVE